MNKKNLFAVLEAPIVSEKSTLLSANDQKYVFRVKKSATKRDIKLAVEEMFKVQVEYVHVLNVKGKTKRFGRFIGSRSDWKKAYVKLEPGFSIDLNVA